VLLCLNALSWRYTVIPSNAMSDKPIAPMWFYCACSNHAGEVLIGRRFRDGGGGPDRKSFFQG